MTPDELEAELAALLTARASVTDDEVERIRRAIDRLPGRRRNASRARLASQIAASVAVIAALGAMGLMFLGGQVSGRLGPVPRTYYAGPSIGGGDTACTTSAPNGDPAGCATPLPTFEPAALAQAVPLEVPSLDIPITRTGKYEVFVGQAFVANGILRDASFMPANGALGAPPSGFTVADMITLDVRPSDPTRPTFRFGGRYRGWHPGTELVNVYIVFDVTAFDPGAVLQVRDLVVR
ncbi:MAG: hypothetical protein ACYDAN_01975 [Candidatus Limnocylindrales bacterium]